MIKITYTNGDTQSINVTADFFPVTVAEKNRKKTKTTDTSSPTERAEEMAFDLLIVRRELNPEVEISKIEVFFPNNPEPKIKFFIPPDVPEVQEKLEEGPSFTKTLKKWKKEWKHKKHSQHWKWTF